MTWHSGTGRSVRPCGGKMGARTDVAGKQKQGRVTGRAAGMSQTKIVLDVGPAKSASQMNTRPAPMRSGQIETGHGPCESKAQHTSGQSPYAGLIQIDDIGGSATPWSVVFRLENVEVPEFWSQVASDVLAQKYFRKARCRRALEEGRGRDRAVVAVAFGAGHRGARRPAGSATYVSENSAKQVFDRLEAAGPIGLEGRLFRRFGRRRASLLMTSCAHAGQADGRAELPQWFKPPACTGLMASTAPARSHYYVD